MLELINIVGSVCMVITGAAAVVTMLVKPVRKKLTAWLSGLVSKQVGEQLQVQVETQMKGFKKNQDRLNRAILYTQISDIYRSSVDQRRLATADRRNLVFLYEAYAEAGGNGYAKAIYEEMMAWTEQVV